VKIDFHHWRTPRRRRHLLPLAAAQSSGTASGATAPRREGAALPALRQATDRARAGLDTLQLNAA
jgi:hypothetical protein